MRLSYANVVATLALILGLGGASYAAVSLPANSVGARQLRSGAVGTSALGFSLGTTGIFDGTTQDLARVSPCGNEPPPPEERPFCSGPPPNRERRERRVTTPGREVKVDLKTGGELLASAVVGLHYEGSQGTRARVTANVLLDGHYLSGQSEVTLEGAEATQMPVQKLIATTPGEHTVGLEVNAQYLARGTGDVLISPVSLIVSALPHT